MAALEFKFSSDQQHQLEAIEATCDLFRGQQFIGSVFSADSGRKGQTAIGELMVGHGNELRVAPGQLLDNLGLRVKKCVRNRGFSRIDL